MRRCTNIIVFDRIGRRTLYLTCLSGSLLMLCIATAMMIVSGDVETADCNKTQPMEASSVVLVVSTVTLTIFINAGPQPIRWILVGELFRQNSRGSAGAVAVCTSRLVSGLTTN